MDKPSDGSHPQLNDRAPGLERELKALRAALDRSAFDVSPCRGCGELVVCLPDGLPYCTACAMEDE